MELFNRVKDTVRDTVASTGVSQKVAHTTGTLKLNQLIKFNEKEIDKITLEIGRDYVEQHLNEEDSEYAPQLERIRELQSEIGKFTEQIENLRAEQEEARRIAQEEKTARNLARQQEQEMRRERERQEAYERQQAAQQAYEERMQARICPACGARNDDDAVFCVSCGKRITG